MIEMEGAPDVDEFELSIFGNGNGESIVVHLGDKRWAVIDSFLTPDNHSVPLNSIKQCSGDDYNIEFVLATHWHNDHVNGMSEILAENQTAKFYLSAALSTKHFINFISLVNQRNHSEMNPASEQFKIFNHLNQRTNNTIHKALYDRVLFKNADIEIKALSPSDKAIDVAMANMINKISQYKNSRNVSRDDENAYSVVIWIEIDRVKLLLGGDLVLMDDPELGWNGIYRTFKTDEKAEVYKVPHHGSKNSHHDGIWKSLISDEVSSIVTNYNRGKNPPPTEEDIHRIASQSRNLYHIDGGRQKVKRDRFIKKVLSENTYMNKGFVCLENKTGQVRFRRKINQPSIGWQIKTTPGIVKHYSG